MTVVDDIFSHVPAGEENALGHRKIWKAMGKWSVISCRHALAELTDDGRVKCKIGDGGSGPPMKLYWNEFQVPHCASGEAAKPVVQRRRVSASG